jgi:hypothetical protein
MSETGEGIQFRLEKKQNPLQHPDIEAVARQEVNIKLPKEDRTPT